MKDGKTALMWSADKGHKEVVKMLLEAGADVELKDNVSNRSDKLLSCDERAEYSEIDLSIMFVLLIGISAAVICIFSG